MSLSPGLHRPRAVCGIHHVLGMRNSIHVCAAEGNCPELDTVQQAERVLFIGWRRDIADLIQILDDFVAPGSELWLYNEVQRLCCNKTSEL